MFTKPVSKWLINQINGCLLRLLLGTYCYWDNCMTQLSQTKSSTVALKHQLAAKFGSWHQSIFFFHKANHLVHFILTSSTFMASFKCLPSIKPRNKHWPFCRTTSSPPQQWWVLMIDLVTDLFFMSFLYYDSIIFIPFSVKHLHKLQAPSPSKHFFG